MIKDASNIRALSSSSLKVVIGDNNEIILERYELTDENDSAPNKRRKKVQPLILPKSTTKPELYLERGRKDSVKTTARSIMPKGKPMENVRYPRLKTIKY